MKNVSGARRICHIHVLVGAITLAATSGCVSPSSILGPSRPREIEGSVVDDGGQLPGGHNASLAGVRVEVLDGQKSGTFVITDRHGTYRLGFLGDGPITVRATKDGFDSETHQFYPEYFAGPWFQLGQPPHTLWGDVVLAGTTSTLVPHVQLEILDGPNSGKVAIADETGRYGFDDLIASPQFALRLSKAGHRTRTYGGMTELRHNRRNNLQIDAE